MYLESIQVIGEYILHFSMTKTRTVLIAITVPSKTFEEKYDISIKNEENGTTNPRWLSLTSIFLQIVKQVPS